MDDWQSELEITTLAIKSWLGTGVSYSIADCGAKQYSMAVATGEQSTLV